MQKKWDLTRILKPLLFRDIKTSIFISNSSGIVGILSAVFDILQNMSGEKEDIDVKAKQIARNILRCEGSRLNYTQGDEDINL